ncbi:MAG TPA: DUF6483 family protein [Ignavibacteria bacterium]|nr:DUF6483 family protein [Ignavibacteria bacterium]
MLQRDYLMKMTQMLTTVLTKVLFNKEKKNYIEAEKEIESAAKTIVGLDLNLIKILNVEDVIKLMKTSDVYAGRCLISAELLKEYGDILGEKDRINESIDIYIKSLWLYLETMLTKELPEPEIYFDRINFLIKSLVTSGSDTNLKIKIFEYYEYSDQYSKAEDILFELVDSDAEGIKVKALKFYERLQMKTDEELAKGNFSLEEVEESIEEINSRYSS